MNRSFGSSPRRTFRQLLYAQGAKFAPAGPSPLEEWFDRVCDTPIDALSLEDTARAFRQAMFVDELALRAEVLLAENPLAGANYPGELARTIAGQPHEFWMRHTAFATMFVPVVAAALQGIDSPSDSAVFKQWMKRYR